MGGTGNIAVMIHNLIPSIFFDTSLLNRIRHAAGERECFHAWIAGVISCLDGRRYTCNVEDGTRSRVASQHHDDL